jgi:enoyl-CoA hydratase
MTSDQDILFGRDGGVGTVLLNRSKALNAFTLDMYRQLEPMLHQWADDPAVRAVLIEGAGDRAFCAGGDVRRVYEAGKGISGDPSFTRLFFAEEYRIILGIHRYAKPYIAIIDGITMGGGAGISVNGAYRIATEHTILAMPETGIGLFPDVGAGWRLPRLPGESGMWLAQTGARLRGADCLALGIATHFVESGRVAELKARLVGGEGIEEALAQFRSDPGPAPIAAHRADIDRLFSGESVEAIFAGLAADPSDWARAQLETLRTKSPQTLKVAFRQLRQGAHVESFAEEMKVEYRIGARVVQRPDFIEGVRAVIVDKDNAPKWSPEALDEVTESMLDEIFAPLPADQEWSALPG